MKKEIFFWKWFVNQRTYFLAVPFLLILISLLFAACKDTEKGKKTREMNSMQVPEGFSLEQAVDSTLIDYPMFASFDNTGRLFLCESTGETFSTEEHLKIPPYHIRLLQDTDGDGVFDKSTIFADSLTYPKGAVFYQGSLYVASAPGLLKLTDTNGDGVTDKREVILTGWVLNHNAATFGGPFMGPDGWLYMVDSRRGFNITTKEGKELKGKSARIWRCRTDGTGLEAVCGGGYDDAVALTFMPAGETIGTMTYFTDPMNGFRDAIMHWEYGGVYPKYEQVIEVDSLKLTGDLMPVMTKLARVSHSGIMRYEGSTFGTSFKGNLFTAQFNTGRIMRYIITPVGATFQTKEEPFLTSTNPDIHLTDVVEDADGSLLVINTGGWFIAGCPLSVVAKKNVKAGIYRIRTKGAKEMDDPWGRKLNLAKMSTQEVVQYVMDSRFAVRRQAIEQLVIEGEPVIKEIKKVLLSSENEEARTAAVFILYRINKPQAMDMVRETLDDKSALVRTAAARVLGMAKDSQSVTKLMELVKTDAAPVRRQAATALGQIGDIRAISALVKASSNPDDRFVEHAIIYSLMMLKSPEPLVEALGDTAASIRKAMLIALDQMEGAPLKKNQLVPFLNSSNKQLQQIGVWVALHHIGWADIVLDFLKGHLTPKEFTTEEESSVSNLMIKFSSNNQIQNFITTQLDNQNLALSKRLLLVDVINHSTINKLPATWVKQLGKLLHSSDPEIRSAVLNLIKTRIIAELNPDLNQIVQDPKTPTDFRLKALSARLMSNPNLSATEFEMVLKYLGPKNESPVRQKASSLLTQVKLNESQLFTLAKEQVATADVFLLPNLVNAYKGVNSEAVGKALIAALQTSNDRLSNLSVQDIQKLFDTYPQSVQELLKPLLAILKEKQATRLAELQKLESQLRIKGDVAAGRALFFGKATCFGCHAVGVNGADFGPDLSNIGEIRSRHDILEAIVYPSASYAREYETSKIATKNSSYIGIIKEQLPDLVIIATGPGSKVRVPRSEILSIEPQSVSMMPPGLDKQLSIGELSDLISFLESLPNGMGQVKSHE